MAINNPESVSEGEINAIIAVANAEVKIMADRESSMLNKSERAAAAAMIKRVLKKYGPILEKKGGVDKVLEEYENYLVTKIGIPESRTSTKHRQGLDEHRTALRTLLDPKHRENYGLYSNVLCKGSKAIYPVEESMGEKQPGMKIEQRKLAALMYLAASDPDQEIPEEVLVGGVTRESIIETSLWNYTLKIAEIARAHNGGGDRLPEDSIYDGYSCPAGTYGRLVKSVLYNPIAEIPINPTTKLLPKSEAYVNEIFRELPKEDILAIAELIEEKFVMMTDLKEIHEDKKNKWNAFVDQLKAKQNDFLNRIREEYGQTVDLSTAEKIYKYTIFHLDFNREPTANPSMHVMSRIEKHIFNIKKSKIIEEVEKNLNVQLDKGASELQRLWQEEMQKFSQASEQMQDLDNAALSRLQNEFVSKQNAIIKMEQELLHNTTILGRNLYETKFKEKDLQLPEKLAVATFFHLDGHKNVKDKMVEGRASWDAQFATFKQKLIDERKKRINEMFSQFSRVIKKDKKYVEERDNLLEKIKTYEKNLMEYIKTMTVRAGEIDLSKDEEKINEIQNKIEGLQGNIIDQFLSYCRGKGLTLKFGELYDTIDKVKNSKELKLRSLQVGFERYHYEVHLEKARILSKEIILNFQKEINKTILELKQRHPAKGSRAYHQMQALELAEKEIDHLIEHPLSTHEKDVDKIIKRAEHVKKIANKLETKFSEIGYPGTFEKFLKAIKIGINKCLNILFKCKLDISHAIKKGEASRLVTFSDPKYLSPRFHKKLKKEHAGSLQVALNTLKNERIEKPSFVPEKPRFENPKKT